MQDQSFVERAANDLQPEMLGLLRNNAAKGGITNVEDLYVSDPVTQGASRMAFAPDGTIYITISGAAGSSERIS